MSKERNRLLREISNAPGVEIVNGKKHCKVYVGGKLIVMLSHGSSNGRSPDSMEMARKKLRKVGVDV